jgi:predicted house-cleaning noncanonical NTP pyrophosphatase (MazG superfamily)
MMILTDKKEVLKEIIENADEKLMGLMIALANEYNDTLLEYSQEEIQEFYKIRDEMLAHPETTYRPEQAHQLIRNKK